MDTLLIALFVMLGGGVLSMLSGPRPRLATWLGAGGSLVGCLIGLAPIVDSIVYSRSSTFHRPWSVPYGSLWLTLDPLSAWFALPILVLCGVAAVYGATYLMEHRGERSLGFSWLMYNVLTATMLGVVLSRNGILFLVAWEVMSISSYFLVVFDDEDAQVVEAGRTYLIATHLGTAFLFAFFAILGQGAGSLDFDAIAAASPKLAAGTASVLFVLAVVGFGTKAGFMPMHVWLPEAHPAAPSHVSAVMSGVMVKTGIYGIIRTLTLLPAGPAWWGWLLVGIGVLSGIWGILFAATQQDIKRLLAYSTVENVGIIALGLGIGLVGVSGKMPSVAVLGFSGALLHVLNHALFKGLLFLGAGALVHATGTRQIDRLGGLAKTMPLLAALFVLGAVAICGLPPLNGFAGEFLIYLGAFRGHMESGNLYAVPSAVVVGALALIGGLAALTFAKVVGIVFLGSPRTEDAVNAHAPGLGLTGPMAVLGLLCVAVGLGSPRIAGVLAPVAAGVAKLAPDRVVPATAEVAPALTSVVTVSGLLLVLVASLYGLRALLFRKREVATSTTWGCGYQGGTPRIQYTGSSFVEPLGTFFAGVFRERRRIVPSTGLFPAPGSYSSEMPDVATELVYRPAFRGIGRVADLMRWIQNGQTHLYILYVALTLIVLLVWYLGLVMPA